MTKREMQQEIDRLREENAYLLKVLDEVHRTHRAIKNFHRALVAELATKEVRESVAQNRGLFAR